MAKPNWSKLMQAATTPAYVAPPNCYWEVLLSIAQLRFLQQKKWSEAPQIANKDHGNIEYPFSNLLHRLSIIFSLSTPNFHFRILEAQGFALWLQPLTRPNASTITDPQHFHKSHIVMAGQLHYYLTSTKLSSIRVPNSCPQRESAS